MDFGTNDSFPSKNARKRISTLIKRGWIFLLCCCFGCQSWTTLQVEDRYAKTWRATQAALAEEGNPHFETRNGTFLTEDYTSPWWNDLLTILSLGAFHRRALYHQVQLSRTDPLRIQLEADSGSQWAMLYLPVWFGSKEQSDQLIQNIIGKLKTLEDPIPPSFSTESQQAIAQQIENIQNFYGKMQYIPGGEFIMGSHEGDEDEKPQFKVVQKGFFLDTHEITVKEYQVFLQAGVETRHSSELQKTSRVPLNWEEQIKFPYHPVVGVSWYDAFAYAKWAGKRLPTEAEYERASRGLNGQMYAFGNTFEASKCSSSATKGLQPVGSYPSGNSIDGCYDLAGNAWEWCHDWYKKDYYGLYRENPTGPEEGIQKVLRGGSFLSAPHELRASYRNKGDPTFRNLDVGFRCAKDSQP